MSSDSAAEDTDMSVISAVDAVTSATGDLLVWIVIGVLTLIGDTYRRIKSNEQQIRNLDRHITGDDEDPSQPGLLSEVHETRIRVDELSDKMDEHHRRTDEKLDELLNDE